MAEPFFICGDKWRTEGTRPSLHQSGQCHVLFYLGVFYVYAISYSCIFPWSFTIPHDSAEQRAGNRCEINETVKRPTSCLMHSWTRTNDFQTKTSGLWCVNQSCLSNNVGLEFSKVVKYWGAAGGPGEPWPTQNFGRVYQQGTMHLAHPIIGLYVR